MWTVKEQQKIKHKFRNSIKMLFTEKWTALKVYSVVFPMFNARYPPPPPPLNASVHPHHELHRVRPLPFDLTRIIYIVHKHCNLCRLYAICFIRSVSVFLFSAELLALHFLIFILFFASLFRYFKLIWNAKQTACIVSINTIEIGIWFNESFENEFYRQRVLGVWVCQISIANSQEPKDKKQTIIA